jgi:hypothetical protein
LTDVQLEQARLRLLNDRSLAVEELLPGARAASPRCQPRATAVDEI